MVRPLLPGSWQATAEKLAASFPCDRYQHQPYVGYVRAIDVAAPHPVVFRWLCQLKVAPYSYDWINNGRRTSPRQLTPGAEFLAEGQEFLVFKLVEFAPDQHLTGVALPHARRWYGDITCTYQVKPVSEHRTRLVVRLDIPSRGPLTWLRRELLAVTELPMMRKQLRTIKQLAEGGIDA